MTKIVLPLLSLCLLAGGCYRVPVTGRSALSIVDEKEVARMSALAFNDIKRQYRVSRDRARTEQLQRVGQRLARVVIWDMPDADWEFIVFDSPGEINAFAMAGGKVGVYSGLFKVADSDDEVASVVAHEIAHVTAKHVQERLSRQVAVGTVGTIGGLGLGASGASALSVEAIHSVYGITTGVTGFAFDRAKEREADEIGLIYMAKAGYDPQAALRVLEKLDDQTGSEPRQNAFLSTHPTTPERFVALRDDMPRAEKIYEEASAARKK